MQQTPLLLKPDKVIRATIIVLILFAGYQFLFKVSPVVHGPGVTAPKTPQQVPLTGVAEFQHQGILIKPLASFDIEARVLSRKDYSFDEESDLSPTDLALGWGNMSDERVLDTLEIKQSNRWYHWRSDHLVIPKREITNSSANMHMVPADDTIAGLLDTVIKGNIVRISGYLIEADSNGRKWRSSLTRTDSGANACELIYVRSIEVL